MRYAFALLWLFAATVRGSEWANPVGGRYDEPANWTAGVPDGTDARFNLGAAYVVGGTLEPFPPVANLVVGNDNVEFRFDGWTRTLAADSYVVGDAPGDVGTLRSRTGAFAAGTVAVGNAAGSTGTVTLGNPFTQTQIISLAADDLTVGGAGAGTLTIASRANVATRSLSIAALPGSVGNVTVAGTYGSLNIRGPTYIGGSAAGPGGTGYMLTGGNTNGETSFGGDLRIYPGGTLRAAGNAFIGVSNAVIEGTLIVDPGSFFSANNLTLGDGAVTVGLGQGDAPIAIGGMAALAGGSLAVDATGVAPAAYAPFAILTAPTVEGTFTYAGATTANGYALVPQYAPDGVTLLPAIPGDANLDRAVTAADVGLLATAYGGPGGWANGDFNFDGTVTVADIGILAAHYGQSAPPPAFAITAVPEPATLVLVALAAATWATVRRRLT